MKLQTKDFDIFGVPFVLTVNRKNTYKSFFGGVASIISIIVILLISSIFSKELFERNQPNIINEYYPSKEIPFYQITNENFFFAVRIENRGGELKDYQNYFTIRAAIAVYDLLPYGWNYTVMDINIDKCSNIINKNKTSSEELDYEIIENYNCLDWKGDKRNEKSDNKFPVFGGDWNFKQNKTDLTSKAPNLTNFYISLDFCNKEVNPNCKSNQEIYNMLYLDSYYLTIVVPSFVYTSSDNKLSNPLKKSFKTRFIPINPDSFLETNVYFNIIDSYDDQDYIMSTQTKNSTFYLNKMDIVTIPFSPQVRSNLSYNGLMNLDVYFSRDLLSIKRSFLKIQELLSQIGGLFSLTGSTIGTLVSHYNVFLRNLSLISDEFNFIDDEKDTKFDIDDNHNSKSNNKANKKIKNKFQIYNSQFGDGRDIESSQESKLTHKSVQSSKEIELKNRSRANDMNVITDSNTSMTHAIDNNNIKRLNSKDIYIKKRRINTNNSYTTDNKTSFTNNDKLNNQNKSDININFNNSSLSGMINVNLNENMKNEGSNESNKLNRRLDYYNNFDKSHFDFIHSSYNKSLCKNDIKIIYEKLKVNYKQYSMLNPKSTDSPENYDPSDPNNTYIHNFKSSVNERKPLLTIGLGFVIKAFCCPCLLNKKQERLHDTYDYCSKIFQEKIGIEYYLKKLDELKRIKSINLNHFQKLALKHYRQTNIYSADDRKKLENEFTFTKGQRILKEETVEEAMSLVLFYMDFIKNESIQDKFEQNNLTRVNSIIDKKIINNLNPLIKDVIQNNYKT